MWYGCSMFLLPSKLLRHRKSRDSTSSRGPVRRRCRSNYHFLKSNIFWSRGIGKCTFWKVMNSNGIIAWNHCKTNNFWVEILQKSTFLKSNLFLWRSFRNDHFPESAFSDGDVEVINYFDMDYWNSENPWLLRTRAQNLIKPMEKHRFWKPLRPAGIAKQEIQRALADPSEGDVEVIVAF